MSSSNTLDVERSQRQFRFVVYALLAASAVFASACGKSQEGGPRRQSSDIEDDDGGIGEPASCAELTCKEPASCVERVDNDRTRAVCSCPRGFTLEGNGCVDTDECASADTNDCDDNALCENRVGSYGCRCKSGFTLEDGVCKSNNTCVGVENTCHPDAACSLDATGGTQCGCVEGYQGDGRACVDVNECEAGTAECAENAHCVNTRTGYDCACDTMYTGDGVLGCRDRCQVALSDSSLCDPSGNGRCVIEPNGEARCTSCAFGFLGDGRRCTSDAACGALDCGDNSVCAGEPGARECACAPGYEGDPAAGCTDVNECTNGVADCDPNTSRCLNSPGSYLCECKDGFERVGDACVNIDECARDTDRCDVNANCSDKTPGYSCECRPGFQSQPDGLSCADIDECKTGEATCRAGDSSVMCVNTRGSYECRCPPGFAGDGTNESCYCDLSGWWAMRQDATLIFPERSAAGQVIVAKSTTYASIWELHKYAYDGEKIVVQKKACGSDVGPEIYSPLYGETYSSSTPNMVFDRLELLPSVDVPLPKTKALPGSQFTTPKSAVVQGIRLNDPLNDPWPTRSDMVPESQWVDTDGDGELGISLWPGSTETVARSGMGDTYDYLPVALKEGSTIIDQRLGCASVALRSVGALSVSIDSCDLMTGTLTDTKVEGRVHSCTVLRMNEWETGTVSCNREDWSNARRCRKEDVQFLDEQEQSNTVTASFEMQKLGGLDGAAPDCAAVRAKLPPIVRDQ